MISYILYDILYMYMATSFINSMTSLVKSFLQPKDSSLVVTGIDIGSSSIKLVEMSIKSGHVVLNNYGSIALGPYAKTPIGSTPVLTSEIVSQALIELFNETKASKNNIVASLPTGLVFT
jgi:Tfp pilus assembly PilM family ATPase